MRIDQFNQLLNNDYYVVSLVRNYNKINHAFHEFYEIPPPPTKPTTSNTLLLRKYRKDYHRWNSIHNSIKCPKCTRMIRRKAAINHIKNYCTMYSMGLTQCKYCNKMTQCTHYTQICRSDVFDNSKHDYSECCLLQKTTCKMCTWSGLRIRESSHDCIKYTSQWPLLSNSSSIMMNMKDAINVAKGYFKSN
jgi:hypothetical protein